jgi:hypothetical protein
MTDFDVWYTEAELKVVRVTAENKEAAKAMFRNGEIDYDNSRGWGDYEERKLKSVELTPKDAW